jgi:hypothetical protein
MKRTYQLPGEALAEALGLDSKRITSIRIEVDPIGASALVTYVLVDRDLEMVAHTLREYRLVRREDAE